MTGAKKVETLWSTLQEEIELLNIGTHMYTCNSCNITIDTGYKL